MCRVYIIVVKLFKKKNNISIMTSYNLNDINPNPNNGLYLILISYGFLLSVYFYYYVL